ncbi:Eco57I restriction-modification methylase domain-containing protein [Acinetobacter baumannii]|uniref:Eco57I restriction-modification methylase domain-containing protein n=1 Tax=Acinetobacter baumannii TaxID=470 RepID=UPI0024482BB5|nr:Eco57I restriction-modification methylase domain-containing protein [Acinetobacter baumannii]MDH2625833.1 Eco57I restriction-modification methylase domain-containing protein [Acinetobacter baumannii]
MNIKASQDKEITRAQLKELVKLFKQNESDYLKKNYNETQVRTDFIAPLLEILGWDIHNKKGVAQNQREVIEESVIDVADEKFSKKPDYELRAAKQRKLFIEAKKPYVNLETNKDAAFQAKRYGFSGSLPIVILTNFYHIAIYDCQFKPDSEDHPHIARLYLIKYDEFEKYFDQLWLFLSRDSIYSGVFDKFTATSLPKKGSESFDNLFLNQVREWRKKLALDIYLNNNTLSSDELTYAVQLFLLRIIFLRICEDREIEKYQNLKNISGKSSFNSFMNELRRADEFYDSGLFRLIDDKDLNIKISDDVLNQIINELYYPLSPYTFAVVETEVLGEIYEQFLGESIIINDDKTVEIVYKPEIRESGGVIPTPRYIVDKIVEDTLNSLFQDKSPHQIEKISIADICCGSGVFLLSVFDYLLNYYLNHYISNLDKSIKNNKIYESYNKTWKLNYIEKRRILITHIRGVDIDHNAIEVAKFSLLLKLIEDETAENLKYFVEESTTPALPELDDYILSGNSLVSNSELFEYNPNHSLETMEKINPFDFKSGFSKEFNNIDPGFDVIVGNPPYIKIQKMKLYSPEEVNFYQSDKSPYITSKKNNFDKYYLFTERSINLTTSKGRLGFIIPNKFISTKVGESLRSLFIKNNMLEEIVDFGISQIFGKQAQNYTCLVYLNKAGSSSIKVHKVNSLDDWKYKDIKDTLYLNHSNLSGSAWSFPNSDVQKVFSSIESKKYQKLIDVTDIFVGLQTSADPIFIFEAIDETPNTFVMEWNNQKWHIEKSISKPFMHDVMLSPYSHTPSNKWLIFPYSFITEGEKLKAQLIQPKDMISNFPLCYKYLTSRKAELEKRQISGGKKSEQQFYQFGRSQSLTKLSKPKITFSVLSKEAKYTYDEQDIMMTGGGNGPYYNLRSSTADISNYFLLALLHHPLIEALIKSQASTVAGGYYSHSKQYMENLPIPNLSNDLKKQVDYLILDILKNQKLLIEASLPHKQNIIKRIIQNNILQLEKIFTEAFELNNDEINLLKNYLIN